MKSVYLTLFTVTVMNLTLSTQASAKNQEIHNFHFSTCNGPRCLELWSEIGTMSQLQFSFSTLGSTHVKISDRDSKKEILLEGSESSYLPTLECITLTQKSGGSYVISLKDFKVETFGSPLASTKGHL